MRFDDFFEEINSPDSVWGASESGSRVLNMKLVESLAKGSLARDDNLVSAISLTQAVRAEHKFYGINESKVTITNEQLHDILRCLRMMLLRHGLQCQPTWNDFTLFKEYWLAHNGYGSWQARRIMVGEVFQPILGQLEQLQNQEITSTLAQPISPHATLGWTEVDEYIEHLRARSRSASSVADYKDVDNRCLGVLEVLSATVLNSETDCPEGGTPRL